MARAPAWLSLAACSSICASSMSGEATVCLRARTPRQAAAAHAVRAARRLRGFCRPAVQLALLSWDRTPLRVGCRRRLALERSSLKAALGGRCSQHNRRRRRLTMAKVLPKAASGRKCSQHGRCRRRLALERSSLKAALGITLLRYSIQLSFLGDVGGCQGRRWQPGTSVAARQRLGIQQTSPSSPFSSHSFPASRNATQDTEALT